MKKIRNKRKIINDYAYEKNENPYSYKNNYYNKIKYQKNFDCCKSKTFKNKKFIKDCKNNDYYYSRYPNFLDCESFYPKNYVQTKKVEESINNTKDFEQNLISEKNNFFSYDEYSGKNVQERKNNLLSLSQKVQNEELNKIF